MNEMMDIESIYRQAKQAWIETEAPRKSIREHIAESVPYWIVLVAFVLYTLSAPHTAAVFEKLTPGWGWISPLGIEFGLLYAAFRRKVARHMAEAVPWTLWTLEILLILTAVLVNGTGAFTSVVSSTQLNALSFSAILNGFSALPATSQAALIMAGMGAFIIPIGTVVAGEGLAKLALERRGATDFREERWREVEFTLTYRAVFVRYLQQDLPDREAKFKARSEVKGYLGMGQASTVRALSAPSAQPESAQPLGTKDQVRAFIPQNPDAVQEKSISQVMSALNAQGVRAGRTTVAEVLREVKQAR